MPKTYIPNLNSPSTIQDRLSVENVKIAQFETKFEDLVDAGYVVAASEMEAKCETQKEIIKALIIEADETIYKIIEERFYKTLDEKRTFE